jgi:amino acid adenylation domain-containing protein/non-ribosomal peptide synthase protein (TIGR01720 family)
MTIVEFLSQLATNNIKIWMDGEKLRYSAPQGALTPDLLAELANRKREIRSFLKNTVPSLKTVSRETNQHPLSFSQLRQWYLLKLEPETYGYNIPLAFRFSGSVNLIALEQSLNEIVRRHESLRTTFKEVEGQPVQVVNPYEPFKLSLIDLQDFSENEKENRARAKAIEEARWVFDLIKGPLFRIALIRLDSKEHILTLTMHHIISDGWSLSILLRELETLYDCFVKGEPSPLDDLPIQFIDYVYWLRDWMQGEVVEHQLAYWKAQLANSRTLLNLPSDRPRPAIQTFRGRSKDFKITQDLTSSLRSQSQNCGVTPFIFLLTVLNTLLYRYTGEDDINVGTYISNRNRAEIESLIGFFINTLVMRTDLSGTPSFRELLDRVREVALNVYSNQDVPFEKLLDALHLKRTTNHTPLFQIMFNFQEGAFFSLNLSDLSTAPIYFESTNTYFDLTWWVYDLGETLSITLEYNTDLFDELTIERMIGHFEIILRQAIKNPEQPISTLKLLSESELKRIFVDKNGGSPSDVPAFTNELCVHQLFEKSMLNDPAKTAVISGDGHLSYQELNERANQLAHHLIKLGVGPETLIGICIGRSTEMIIAIFGVLKAGGAYVPLDPGYPKERLAFMLRDSGARVLLTQQPLLSSIPKHDAKVVLLDRDWSTISSESTKNPNSEVSPDNLAYVIYTSGSTGRPKGVMIQHRSLVNYTETASIAYDIESSDRVLQFASINFDTSAEEIYPCLSKGATLLLRTDTIMGSAALFLETCQKWQITVLNLPTAYWHELVNQMESENLDFPSSIHLVIIGGEKALPERLSIWHKKVKDNVQLMNTYGPTEATIVTTMCELLPEMVDIGRELPIGFAIPNTQVYILDANLQLVPIGVPGELYISGNGLARGYLNDPELTSEKFVLNPFSVNPGARMYKTGDRARFFADGNIEFLGRIDHQVKIRGYRIETSEIETVLRQHPDLREIAVVAREDTPGVRRLVAYFIARPGTSVSISDLRSLIKDKLPDYMMPSVFMLIEALPISTSGKIDTQALPVPEQDRSGLETTYVAARSEIEETLAKIWSGILKVENVGIHDNFFELGGDSILSLQVIARANQADIQLKPIHMIKYQTIAELALVADKRVMVQAEQGIVTGPVLLTPYQHWFFEQDLPEPHHWNIAFLLEIKKEFKSNLVQKALQYICIHHDAFRLRFIHEKEGWEQFNNDIDSKMSLRFVQVDLTTLSEKEQIEKMSAATAEQQASLDLANGPLMAVVLFDLGQDKLSRMLIVVHHMIIDGISFRILLEDFVTAYQQLEVGEGIVLPAKTTSYKQWAERLNGYAQSDTLNQQIDYWLEVVNKEVTPLPVDHPDGANTWGSAKIFTVSLTIEETQALLREVPAAYSTQINDVLLTALVLAFSRWTGSQSLLFDLEGHGREDIFEDLNLSRTIGCFTALFPVIMDISNIEDDFGAQLKVIKESLRRIPQHGVGYGLLRYLSNGTGVSDRLKNLPQAEISFNYLGQFDQVLPHESPFSILPSEISSIRSPHEKRRYLLEILGRLNNGQLNVGWIFSDNIYNPESVENVANDFIKTLRDIIKYCQSAGVGGYTPSDFPGARLDQKTLDKFLAKIGS